MAAKMGTKIASIVLRVLTFVLLFISIIVLATSTHKVPGYAEGHFYDVNSYKYAMATIILGGAFNLLQIALALYRLVTKTDENILFNFYGDKVLSYLLLSGAAAALGGGIDLKAHKSGVFASLYDQGNGAAALLLLSFFCSAVVSVLSSLAISTNSTIPK